jgi:hypothetical protein
MRVSCGGLGVGGDGDSEGRVNFGLRVCVARGSFTLPAIRAPNKKKYTPYERTVRGLQLNVYHLPSHKECNI